MTPSVNILYNSILFVLNIVYVSAFFIGTVSVQPEQILTHTFENVINLKVGEERHSGSVIFVKDLPWSMSIQRVKQVDDKTSLGFFVSCNKTDKTDWSCEAVVEQRLLPVIKDIRIKAKRGSIDVYKTSATDMGYPNFIDWDDVSDSSTGYMGKNGEMTFQIVVDVKSVHRNNPISDRIPKQTLTHTFPNVPSLEVDENRCSKSVMYVNELPWKIIIMRLKQQNGQTTLGLIASCNKDDKSNWSCKARVEYRLLPVRNGVEVKTWTGGIDQYNKLNPNYGVPDIFVWEDAVDVNTGFISEQGDMTFQIVVDVNLFDK